MKKLIGTAMLAALLATSAFAEISLGTWLRAIAAPAAGNGDSIYSGMTNSWGWGTRVARVDINGASEDGKIGFSMGVYNDVGGIGDGDNKAIWAKPWDWLKISLGRWDYTTFRGDLCFGSWNWIRPNNWLFDDEGLTFDQLGAKSGMQLEVTPVEGLVVMWNLPMGGNIDSWDKAYKMFEQQDIAAKYTIGNIGTIKAGWGGKGDRKYKNKGHDAGYGVVVGDKTQYYASRKDGYEAGLALKDTNPAKGSADEKLMNDLLDINSTIYAKENYFDAVDPSGEVKYWGDVNVAFDLTAVENLYLTVGAKISIADSDYKEKEKKDDPDFGFLKVALGASYQILDNLKIAASFGVQTYEEDDPSFQFGVGLDVGLTDALTLNVDFRGLFVGDRADGKSTDPTFSFLAGLQYAMSSNGYVGIGFQGTTGGTGFLGKLGYEDKFSWAVPIAVSCWF
ncbi:MAG: DUF481 domain-containing protein [Treponema sp.]|nr:DUF481 domain-containing protein [Treponema sp.]